MNNSTSLALAKHDKNVLQDVGVSPPKGGWALSDRWAWALGLPVSGIARAVAGSIAYHANDKTGLSWPGMGLIVKETGFKRTAVIEAIKVLERGGHVTVRRFKVGKKNVSNRYQLPPMGNVSASHSSPPDGLGGSPPDGPELVRTEPVKVHTQRARVSCETHGRTWYEANGVNCFECAQERLAVGAKRTPRKPKGGMPTYHERPPRPDVPMTAQQTADAEERAVSDGWRQVGGSWRKAGH